MKITFVDPPNFINGKGVERVFGCTYSLYPVPNIFSLSAAALLEHEGHSVKYIDMASEGWGLKRVRNFFRSDDSDIFVFYSVNLSISADLFIFRIMREYRKNVKVIFSGPAPTYFKERFLADEDCIVARGEAEEPISESVRGIKERNFPGAVKGISYRVGDNIVDNPPRELLADLDSLPFPARHLAKRALYYNPKLVRRPFTAVQTSRNCSYRCNFCVPNSSSFACELEHRAYNSGTKPPVRMRSTKNVVEEFRQLAKSGYRTASVIDDQFLWHDDRTADICEGIKGCGIQWGCLARADRITPHAVVKMKEAGCVYVDLGVESFSQEVLDDAGKGLKVERVYEAIRTLKENDILTKINLMLGLSPLQTEGVIKNDIGIAKRLDVDACMFSIATPFPGTDFYERAMSARLFVESGYRPENVQSRSIISYPNLSAKKMDAMARMANLYFYFSPRFLVRNLKRLAYPINLYYSLRALKRKLV